MAGCAMGRTLHVHRQNFQAIWISINQRQDRYSQHVSQALQEYPAQQLAPSCIVLIL